VGIGIGRGGVPLTVGVELTTGVTNSGGVGVILAAGIVTVTGTILRRAFAVSRGGAMVFTVSIAVSTGGITAFRASTNGACAVAVPSNTVVVALSASMDLACSCTKRVAVASFD